MIFLKSKNDRGMFREFSLSGKFLVTNYFIIIIFCFAVVVFTLVLFLFCFLIFFFIFFSLNNSVSLPSVKLQLNVVSLSFQIVGNSSILTGRLEENYGFCLLVPSL